MSKQVARNKSHESIDMKQGTMFCAITFRIVLSCMLLPMDLAWLCHGQNQGQETIKSWLCLAKSICVRWAQNANELRCIFFQGQNLLFLLALDRRHLFLRNDGHWTRGTLT